jgi:hypothetical protein
MRVHAIPQAIRESSLRASMTQRMPLQEAMLGRVPSSQLSKATNQNTAHRL